MTLNTLPSMVLCAGVFVVVAFAQPLGTASIYGTVVDGESGEGIRKAVVTLTLEGTPRRWATARTDGSGHFQFEGLPAGKYDLRATKDSEGTAIYGANKLRELGGVITLGDGETRGSVTLRFLRGASISGQVLNPEGEPEADVNVSLLRQGRNLGAPILVQYRQATTDERGEYHFANVDPGRYYLRTTPREARMSEFGGMHAAHQPILVDQYYGGTRDPKEAAPVHVGGGENLAGLDFHLTSEPAVEIRGRILGVPEEPESPTRQPAREGIVQVNGVGMGAGRNGPGIQVSVSPADPGSERWSMGSGAQGPEHRFQWNDLPAGRYRIEAVGNWGGRAYGASQIFDLHPDFGEILLTLVPAVDIHGTLRVEGQAAPGAKSFSVQLERPDTRMGNISAELGADGRFSLPQVLPGQWQLSVTPVPPGFLKSAQFGEKDVRFTTFEAGSNSDVPLNIVVSMHTATVQGEIDAGSAEAKRAGIVIAPVGPYHNLARFYYGATAGDDGKFHLAGIAPGKYQVFAIERMTASSFRNPESVDQLENLGEVIDVGEEATVEAHPKLIPAERAARALQ
jgi:hypothetical protein